MQFEWDSEKDKINQAKHGIKFQTAKLIFNDPNRIELYDEAHSDFEERYITIGMIDEVAFVVTVVYTERQDAIRLISARRATKKEQEVYYHVDKRYW